MFKFQISQINRRLKVANSKCKRLINLLHLLHFHLRPRFFRLLSLSLQNSNLRIPSHPTPNPLLPEPAISPLPPWHTVRQARQLILRRRTPQILRRRSCVEVTRRNAETFAPPRRSRSSCRCHRRSPERLPRRRAPCPPPFSGTAWFLGTRNRAEACRSDVPASATAASVTVMCTPGTWRRCALRWAAATDVGNCVAAVSERSIVWVFSPW
ncbi:hypothetical protein GGR53DRAFT_510644 [Hypoxylon sp. FL1150]|nr:hypothetical protein GGR53DRAFT_510644 [Hypoxylon sp. FL1150]